LRIAVAALVLLALSGCLARKRKPSNENFRRAINAYFYTGHDECLLPTAIKFPNEVKVAEKQEMRQMDALAKAGLLTRLEDGAFQLVRYSLTPMGTRATSRFCFGHRDVTSIDSYTPPRQVEGRQASDVTYRYRLVDSPQWADDDGLKKVFPKLAAETAASPVGKTTVMTAYDRWEVPDYGAPVIQ
jgi:hypothetical protein